jgi:PKD repeat protein
VTVTIGSPTELDVAWSPSTDDVAVTGYHVYRDGTLLRTVAASPFADIGLTSGVQHCYAISAFDAWHNESPPSASVCGTPAHRPPLAVLSGAMSTLTGAPVRFDAGQSRGVDSAIVSYRFDFGDGSPPLMQATAVTSHTYASLGTFMVTLTVTDDAASVGTASAPLTAGLVLSTPVNVSNTPGLSQTASAFREADGSVDVVWEENRWDILFARSTDGGLTFATPKYVVDPSGTWGSKNGFAARQMQVVAAGGVIHVTLSIFDQVFGGAEIFYSHSTDAGGTFSAPLMVSTPDTYGSYIPSMAADGDGTVFIVWDDDDQAGGPLNGLHYARSADNGGSFSTPGLLLANQNTSCPSVVGSSALIAVAWPQGPIGAGQEFFARSTDGAKTFSAPLALDRLTQHTWCPKLAWDASGVIYATWEEDAAPEAGRILFARSTDGGATFSAAVALSSPAGNGTVPAVAAGPAGRVYVTWMEGFPGPGTAYLAFSSDHGSTFSPALRIDAGALGPGSFTQVLAVDDTHLALVTNAPPNPGAPSDIFYVNAQISAP